MNNKNELLNEISIPNDGGFYLHKKTDKDDAQTVKLYEDKLIIALYQNLVCFEIPELKLNWNLEPDEYPIYEFLEIENDILLRGELQIFRITKFGKIIWSQAGEDIWVNIDGKREMQLNNGNVELIDFNGKQYVIPIGSTRLSNISDNIIPGKEVKGKMKWLNWLFGK